MSTRERPLKWLLLVALWMAAPAVTAGCVSGKQLTAKDIDTHGTRTYDKPMDAVMKAAAQALAGEGYEIAIVNPEKGILKTARKRLGTQATGNANSANVVTYSRVFMLRFNDVAGKTKVVATPSVYANDNDLSAGAVWVIEGPQGEVGHWQRLFKGIDEML